MALFRLGGANHKHVKYSVCVCTCIWVYESALSMHGFWGNVCACVFAGLIEIYLTMQI